MPSSRNDRLFGVLDAAEVALRASRAVPLYRSTIPRPGEVFDYIAKAVMDAPEDQREQVFLGFMKPYLQTELATDRWKKLNALARAFKADFKQLVAYFNRHDIPTRHRAPKQRD